MKNAHASTPTTSSTLPSTSDPPRFSESPRATDNGSPSTSKTTPDGSVPVMGLPAKRGKVIPIHPAEDEPYINPYRDPSKVLERKQFIEFGCGACHFHQRKLDRSAFHCTAGISLWPDGTNKTCRWYKRRKRHVFRAEPSGT